MEKSNSNCFVRAIEETRGDFVTGFEKDQSFKTGLFVMAPLSESSSKSPETVETSCSDHEVMALGVVFTFMTFQKN